MSFKLRRTLLGAATWVLLGGGTAWGQTGAIVGRATSGAGDPEPGISVQVLSGAGRVVASGSTAADGRYALRNVPAGTYTVSFRSVGFRDEEVAGVVVTSGATTTVDIALVISAFQLEQIAVSGTRGVPEKTTESVSAVSVVDQLDIEERPATSPTDHLRNVQGVDVVDAGIQSSNVVVRGFNNIFSGSLHMLTDYRIASVPSLRVNFLHFVPQTNEDLERLEVVRGPASALYGPNTANGVLHMITKSPFDEQATTFTASGGERSLMHFTGRTSQLLSENVGFKLSGQYLQAEDWSFVDPIEAAARAQATSTDPAVRGAFIASMPRNPDGSPLSDAEIAQRLALIGVRDNDLQRWSIDGRLDWRPSSDLSAVVSAGRTVSGSGVELTGIGAGQVQDWAYSYYQGRLNWRRLFLQAYLNTSDAGDTYLLRTGQPITDRSKLFVSQIQHGTDFGARQSFTYGVDFIRTLPETEGSINGAREDEDNMTEWGAYLQSTTRLTPKFDLVLAGRLDDHSHLPEIVFSPRAAVLFKPVEGQSFRASYNRAFSTPSSLNLFLDIDGGWAGDRIGPLGFRARAYGPGEDGIRFRNPAGGLFGMRSPSAQAVGGTGPSDLLEVTGPALYRLQIENFLRAAQLQGQDLGPLLPDYLRSLQADPTLPTGYLALDAITSELYSPDAIQDVPGIRESITQTFEVGYNGVLGRRLLLAADVWFDKKDNFTSPLLVQSPLLLMNPQTLVPFLVQRLMLAGVPQDQATALATSIAGVPGAVVGSPDATAGGADLLATYRNFGEVELWGVDLGTTILLTDSWQFGVTASFVSDDHFRLDLDGVPQIVALNAPKRKGSATLNYRNLENGLNGELRVRHNAEFPVNSAGYVGMEGCVDFDFGEAVLNEPCVESFNLVDVGVGYKLPMMRGTSVQLYVQNVLDEDFRGFIGTPTIGRMATLRVKYEF